MDSLHVGEYGLASRVKASLDAFARCSQCYTFAIERPSGRIVYASPNLTRLYGMPLDQIYEKDMGLIYSTIDPQESKELIIANKRAVEFIDTLPIDSQLKSTVSFSYHITLDGRKVLVSHRCTPMAKDMETNKWLILNMMFLSLARRIGNNIIFYEEEGQQKCRVFNRRSQRWEKRESALTKTQIDILRYVSRGYAEKEIAEEMNKSISTIKFHKKNICDVLGVNSIHEALVQSYNFGLLY